MLGLQPGAYYGEANRKVRGPDGQVLAFAKGNRSLVTSETVVAMERAAKADQDHPIVRQWAIDACSSVGECRQPGRATCKAIERIIRERVLYVQGPYNVQLLHEPGAMVSMQRPSGNCVDMSTLASSMALSVGLSPSLMRMAFTENDSDDPFEHVIAVVECHDNNGQPDPVLIDATVSANQVDAVANGAARSFLHDPIGRPSVETPTPKKEDLTVYPSTLGAVGVPSHSYDADGKAVPCGCGSGRLAGTDSGGCSTCSCGSQPSWSGHAGMPTPTMVAAELQADLAGEYDYPLSTLLAYVERAAGQVELSCPKARGQREGYAWVQEARAAAGAARKFVLMAEQNANAYRSPQAKAALAVQINSVLPANSLVEWSTAALEALSEAAVACGLAADKQEHHAGTMGAAGDLVDRFVDKLIPSGPVWAVIKAAAKEFVAAYDIASICENLPDTLVEYMTKIPGAGITKEKIVEVCGSLLGHGMTEAKCRACRRDLTPVPAGMEALVGAAAMAQPLNPAAGPYEGDWTMTNITGRFAGGQMPFRIFDRGMFILGGSPGGYKLVAVRTADGADGWMEGSDGTLTCVHLMAGLDRIDATRVSCDSCPANCEIFSQVAFTRAAPQPQPGGGSAGGAGIPGWAIAAAAVAAVAAASQ